MLTQFLSQGQGGLGSGGFSMNSMPGGSIMGAMNPQGLTQLFAPGPMNLMQKWRGKQDIGWQDWLGMMDFGIISAARQMSPDMVGPIVQMIRR
jgi:hypothetical protein